MSVQADIPAETNDGEVTSWIPLTSTFTPSSGCESIFKLNGPSLVAFDPGYGLDIDTAVKCAPSAVTTWWEQARLGVGGEEHTALSIQPLVCPHEWTTVGKYTKDTSTTQIMCCPSGYSNRQATSGPVNGDCVSNIPEGMVMTYAFMDGNNNQDWTTTTTTMSAESSVGAIAVVGFNVKRAESSSTTQKTSSSPTSSPSPSPTVTIGSPSSTGSPSPTSPPIVEPLQKEGMSIGIKVGIGLGAAVGFIGIIALIVAIIMFRRRSQKKAQSSGVAAPVPVPEVSENGNNPFRQQDPEHHYPVYELYSHYDYEPHQLNEMRSPVELENKNGRRF